MTNSDRSENDPETEDAYRWTCPFCNVSRVSLSINRNNAINALRNHIRVGDGNKHGPRGEYPDTIDFSEHITKIDAPK